MKIAIVAMSLLLATAMPATAGHYGGGGTDWGAVAGAGILGAILGAAAAPQPQPQIIVVVPQPYVPQPTYASPPPTERHWWCPTSFRWYPEVVTCAMSWTETH